MLTTTRQAPPKGRPLALIALPALFLGLTMAQDSSRGLGQVAGEQVVEKAGRRTYMGREIAQTMHWSGANWLMRETRENEENGAKLLEWLDVGKGASVADLGCGNGYHTIPLARAVGDTGRVFAVDLQPEMLELLDERVRKEAAKLQTPLHVTPVVASIDNPNLPPNSCEFVLMVDVYHELSHPRRVLNAIRKSLREEGVVVLVEFRAEDKAVPIKPRHKMTKAQVIAEMAANEFVLVAETDDLPWQHAMAFAPAPEPDAEPAAESEGSASSKPPLGATAMTSGFLDAMAGEDPRIVAPFLARAVMMDGGLPWDGKSTSVKIGEWMKSTEAPLIAEGTAFALERTASGRAIGRLTPPEGGSIFQDRRVIELERNEQGLWLINAWHPAK